MKRLGYACINSSLEVCCNKTCRLATVIKQGEESGFPKGSQGYSYAIYIFLTNYSKNNLEAMYKIIAWSRQNNIFFYRMSSDMFPHINNLRIKEHMTNEHWENYTNLIFATDIIFEIGKYVQKYEMRLTMHPEHYNQLGTNSEEVLQNTITDLKWHTLLLDLLEMGADAYCQHSKNTKKVILKNVCHDSILCLHGGGTYNNKKETIVRWKKNFKKLPENIQRRICLENCEKGYNVEDLLPICQELKIPLIFDFHHYDCWKYYHVDNPEQKSIEELFPLILDTWKVRNIIPKFHLSDQAENKKIGAHHDYVEKIPKILLECKYNIDIMIEAKMKEKATLRLKNKYSL